MIYSDNLQVQGERLLLVNLLLHNLQKQRGQTLGYNEKLHLSKWGVRLFRALTPEQMVRSSTWLELYSLFRTFPFLPVVGSPVFCVLLMLLSAAIGEDL